MLSISGRCPRRDVGCLLALGGRYINPNKAPILGSAFSHFKALQNPRAGLITCFAQDMLFIHTSTLQDQWDLERQAKKTVWVDLVNFEWMLKTYRDSVSFSNRCWGRRHGQHKWADVQCLFKSGSIHDNHHHHQCPGLLYRNYDLFQVCTILLHLYRNNSALLLFS